MKYFEEEPFGGGIPMTPEKFRAATISDAAFDVCEGAKTLAEVTAEHPELAAEIAAAVDKRSRTMIEEGL